jgi:hypothetical protein
MLGREILPLKKRKKSSLECKVHPLPDICDAVIIASGQGVSFAFKFVLERSWIETCKGTIGGQDKDKQITLAVSVIY